MIARILTAIYGQPAICSQCSKLVWEKRRKPCPSCGGLARIYQRSSDDFLGTKDRAG